MIENAKKDQTGFGFNPEYPGGEDPDLNFLARFKRFERVSQIGMAGTLLIAIAVIFWLNWFNYNWWLVWPLALFSLRNLQRQRVSLSQSKPFEARFNNLFFVILIVLMVIRDLVLTVLIK